MAKTLFGALIVDMRNKLGGHVLSKNKGGSFIRRKVSPTQPNTGAQRLIRGILTSISRAWSGALDDAMRAAWAAFAAVHPITDVFGQTIKLTGQQIFVALNNVVLFLGGVIQTLPPDSLAVAAITDFAPSATETVPSFMLATVLPATIAANERYVAWATPGNPAGKTALQSQLTYIDNVATLTAGNMNILTDYVSKYGVPQAGTKVLVGIRVQNRVTGASSPLVAKIITVGA